MDRDTVLRRIKALTAKTTANGCTEEEALAAAAKVGALIDEYDISMSEADLRAQEETCIHRNLGGGRAAHPVQFAMVSVANFCDVTIWKRGGACCLLGLPADVEAAEFLHGVVKGAMDHDYRRYKRQRQQMAALGQAPALRGGTARATFMRHFARRVSERLYEMKQARTEQARIKRGTGRSLIVVKNAIVAQALKDKGIKLNNRSKSYRVKRDHGAALAGYAAGNNVNLTRGAIR